VAELALVTPPGLDGSIHPAILAAAAIAGVDEVYRVGGAQGIAALAYGTETIPAVDVIVGPGNVYVATAERLVAQEGAVGVPTAFTGPSEVAVVADGTIDADWAAIDLVVQAEHGPDGLAYLITWSEPVADAVTASVDRFTAASPRRTEITSTLERGGWAVLVDGPEQAIDVANVIAAEHLELQVEDPERLVAAVRNAGAVFTGPWAPASVGDYMAGPSHVLPTARSARYGSALRVDDFCKHIHVVDLDRGALVRLAPHVAAIAGVEGLVAHAESVLMRARGEG
jgi:histidinol dehydrogenase